MAVTIYDVAKEAGVSIATVSKALNDSYTIPDQTKAAIREIADRLGYRPNARAKNFARQAGGSVLLAQLSRQCLCGRPRRIGRVEQDEKRLADVLQLCNDARFCRGIVLPRELGHAAVGRDDNAARRVLADNIARSLFRTRMGIS